MERRRSKELLQGVSIGLLAVAVTSCVPTGTEAYTTPLGVVYLNGSENDPQVVAHEEEHLRQMQEDGVVFWWKYNTDSNYRCEMEKRANEKANIIPSDSHPYCDQIKK